LAVKTASEMTYTVSGGALNSTQTSKARGLHFYDAKDLREIRPRSPPTEAPNAGGVVKISDFRQIAGYISKTVQDRRMVSIKVE